MLSLKADNDRLQRMVTSKGGSLSPPSEMPTSHSSSSLNKRLSLGDAASLGTSPPTFNQMDLDDRHSSQV